MPMSAVHNPFQHHSSSPVAIPLVLGANSVNYNKQIFNAPPGLGLIAKIAGREAVQQTTEELAQKAAKEAGAVTRDVAEDMARKQVTRQFIQTSLAKGAKYYGPIGLKYGAIAGVGWAIFKFGNGAMGALGDILGDAGADAVQGATQWMGNNPGLAAAGTGVILFLIGGVIIGMLAPATAAKKVKDTVTSDEDGE